ncbi:UDP-glucose--hexose-1-phosphate uridylyltransferase [Ignavigranum ruoffiae]|uniref:UDP-glucose--hexose-1-phosphate uridylyltransferase n=1 Tax=Ignavigranum ruoffiae TaxID=89093 RepID=UPI00205A482A|nr:UDP-glucose--hexose-1-phosphate uridylyltransferase [Ignavigranum ruoffiae]UPQ85038.1 UDP-glucose--hexose-1-phosphate uridylyltransferase [Ignavigranum ruoffiae]
MVDLEIDKVITEFVNVAIEKNYLKLEDRIYTTNQLLKICHLEELRNTKSNSNIEDQSLLNLMDQIIKYCIKKENVINISQRVEQLESEIMDLITPVPSRVNEIFWQCYEKSPQEATDYFYNLSKENNYIRTREIAKNIHFVETTKYGNVEITINLSKPEKTVQEIQQQVNNKESRYPKCVLCIENEGYMGSNKRPARMNHRLINFNLNGKPFAFQFSPYVYYNEHSIFLNHIHTPMSINRNTFENLFSIIKLFPHYFVGSNADLPIVGGSILSHDHYQGGFYKFPIEDAKISETFQLQDFSDVSINVLFWPLTVFRLKGKDANQIVDCSEYILKKWQNYSDLKANIISHSGITPHNTVTPILRKIGDAFEFDLVLRNNRCSKTFPEGIFHPHRDVHHIKQENIGLIEVMGLAILPGRLIKEIEIIKKYLRNEICLDMVPEKHQKWTMDLEKIYKKQPSINIDQLIRSAISKKFIRVLEDGGVFKQDNEGKNALDRFINHLKG